MGKLPLSALERLDRIAALEAEVERITMDTIEALGTHVPMEPRSRRDVVFVDPAEYAALKAEVERLREALSELADLMDAVVTGEYTPDTFTTQPARRALKPAQAEEERDG